MTTRAMTRCVAACHGRILCTALVLVLGATNLAAAQEETPAARSLAERISSFRFGWGRKSAEAEGEAKAAPKAKPSTSANPSRAGNARSPQRVAANPTTATKNQPPLPKTPRSPTASSAADSIRRRLPRLDPRDLLPQDFLSRRTRAANGTDTATGEPSSGNSERKAAGKAKGVTQSSSADKEVAGTARARIMRGLRQGQEEAVAPSRRVTPSRQAASTSATKAAAKAPTPLTRRAPARVGSVLSTTNTKPTASTSTQAASPKTGGGAKLDAEELRAELLGPGTTKPAAKASRAATKSLAAEIAKELAESPSPKPATKSLAKAQEVKKAETSAVVNVPPAASDADTAVGSRYAKSEPNEKKPEVKPEVALAAPSVEVETIPDDQPAIRFGGVTSEGRVAGVRSPSFSSGAKKRPAVVDATVAPLAASEAELLMSEKMPLIASRVDGPRRIVIGRKAEYKVVIANRGEAAAEDLVARVQVPAWAEVASMDASRGAVRDAAADAAPKTIEWCLDRFEAKSVAQLNVSLIARQGRPIELGVDWSHAPIGAKTVVEVQEPKLDLSVSGPDEVLFGKPQRYQLTLSNPGSGTAEAVTIHLLPPGKSEDEASRHTIGPIAAGVSKTVEIELTAREAGELRIQARATANGGVEALADKQLFCRKPLLEVDWRGPAQKYSGAEATYYFRVRNPGTASAEGVSFVVDLPPGFELQATSPGQRYDAAKRRLSWKVGSLRPGDDKYLQIRGVSNRAGENKFGIAAATADRLVGDRASAATQVIAVADLRLDVIDPKGPLPVGADVVYEIRVKNRGTNTAESVNIVAMFSEGIEPHAVDGGRYSLSDGRVAFDTIESLAAGAEQVVRIKARAEQAGTHIFRAEVVCRDLDIKLAEEEMTRFYAEQPIQMNDATRAARSMDAFVYPR